jgi:hypothetical protein
MLFRATKRLSDMKIFVHTEAFDVARILTFFTTEKPCSRQKIFDVFYTDTNLTEANRLRKFHGIIEELRTVWLMPVGSRKPEPCGYWIITELEDFKAWYKGTTSAPITQLTTIHRVAKHNFPVFAEQIELDFFSNVEPEVTAQ